MASNPDKSSIEIVDQTVSIYKNYFGPFCLVSFGFQIFIFAMTIAFTAPVVQEDHEPFSGDDDSQETSSAEKFATYAPIALAKAQSDSMAMNTLISIARPLLEYFQLFWLIAMAMQVLSGQKGSIARAGNLIVRKIPMLFGLTIVLGILYLIGFLLFIVPGIILLSATICTVPIALHEKQGVFATISRAWKMSKGYRMLSLTSSFIITLIISVFALGLVGAAALIAADSVPLYLGLQAFASAITTPLMAIFIAVLYFHILNSTEGADIEAMLESPE